MQQEYNARLSGFAEERIAGIKAVKVFNHEEEDKKDFLTR